MYPLFLDFFGQVLCAVEIVILLRCHDQGYGSNQVVHSMEMQKLLGKILLINECVDSIKLDNRPPALHIGTNW